MLESESWSAVLTAIVEGPLAWSGASDLAEALAWEVDSVCEVLCELTLNGLVEPWARADGVAHTLTPLAARGLEVHIVERGLNWRPRWEPIDRRRRVARPGRGTDDGALARVPDPGPGPAEIAEASDELSKWRPRGPMRVEHLPRPTVLLMGCETDWSERSSAVAGRHAPTAGATTRTKRRCSACQGRRLSPSTYCLRCNRWGLDGLIAAHRRAAAAARESASA
jgi:hypothetical protein